MDKNMCLNGTTLVYVPKLCCETAGFSWGYKMNHLNKSLSINVFHMQGMAFIPISENADTSRESDAKMRV
jgi:hypothetical protein